MKKRYSDPLCYSAMMLTDTNDIELNGSQGIAGTDNEPWSGARFLGINGDMAQDPALEVNGSGGQEAVPDGIQILGTPIGEQTAEEASESVLEKVTGETVSETLDTPGTEAE